MTYKIEFDNRIKSKIKKYDKHERVLLFKVMEKIAEDPLRGKPLRYSLKGLRRVVFKHYRIIYKLIDEDKTVFIVEIEHRERIYRR
jgi:mRNA interferase RelE/StbE